MDDFLLERSTAVREWCTADIDSAIQVLRPETDLELDQGLIPMAAPFDDGMVRAADGRWRVWYMAGWFGETRMAESSDGLTWERVDEPMRGLPSHGSHGGVLQRDGATVCLDRPNGRYVMFRYTRERPPGWQPQPVPTHDSPVLDEGGALYASDDGVRWSLIGETGPCGDNTTIHHDPFRGEWVASVRTSSPSLGRTRGRVRAATADALAGWTADDVEPWIAAMSAPERTYGDLEASELYKLTCMPYESALLGVFALYRGPSNDYCERFGVPKVIDLYMGISRDGAHWSVAPQPVLRSSQRLGTWHRGYLHAVNGGIQSVENRTRLYFTAFSGISPALQAHMYAGGSMGFVTLRRDGWCALTAASGREAEIVTRPLDVRGRTLFLNMDARGGRVEAVVTVDGHPPVRASFDGDSTAHPMLDVPGDLETRTMQLQLVLTGRALVYSLSVADEG